MWLCGWDEYVCGESCLCSISLLFLSWCPLMHQKCLYVWLAVSRKILGRTQLPGG